MLFGDDMQDSRSPLSGRVVCMLGSFTQSNAVMQRKEPTTSLPHA